jgi:hypothetical protein
MLLRRWGSLLCSSSFGLGLLVTGILIAIAGINPLNYFTIFAGIFLFLIGLLWNNRQSIFEKELMEIGICQKWTKDEPDVPPDSFEVMPESIGDFISFAYAGSDILGGVAHVQCSICQKWSVFPLVHIDGASYRHHQLAIHLTICHPDRINNIIHLLKSDDRQLVRATNETAKYKAYILHPIIKTGTLVTHCTKQDCHWQKEDNAAYDIIRNCPKCGTYTDIDLQFGGVTIRYHSVKDNYIIIHHNQECGYIDNADCPDTLAFILKTLKYNRL